MPRANEEWIGRTDDTQVPPHVRLRVLARFGFKCNGQCGYREIRPGDRWICDHVVALINGGPNRETNLQPLCGFCAPKKDASDVSIKSKTYEMSRKHFGIKRKSNPIPGSRASGWKHKLDGSWVRR